MKNCLMMLVIILLSTMILTSICVEATPNFTLIYVVQEGDTLYDIARDYGISVELILKHNNLTKNSFIKVGQELVIPRNKEDQQKKTTWNRSLDNFNERNNYNLDVGSNYSVRVNKDQPLPEVNIPDSKIITYHIGMGDTLYDLAKSFNTSVGVIMALNNMENSILRTGDTIRLPIHNLSPRQVLARVVKPSEIELLARTIHGEARGEPFIGQVAVGAVIINRVLSSYFPDTFKRVIYQSGQFSAVADGQINLTPNRTAYRAARTAIKGTDPTMGSLYYYNPETARNKNWFSSRKLMVTIGDHVFTK